MEPSTREKPDVNIKPVLNAEDAKNILREFYGFSCKSITELNGYDDMNYKVSVGESYRSDALKVCENGYVLKILNRLDSMKLDIVDGQNSLMIFLMKNGIKCPKLIKSVKENYFEVKQLSSGNHVVRLLEFIPGKIFHELKLEPKLFYELGKFAADIDLAMKNFHHTAYDTYRTLWTLDSALEIRAFFPALTADKQAMVDTILTSFEKRVLSIRNRLTPGMIHGDFNEQNVVVKENDDGSWNIEAILDFGDSQFSCLLYELAITMTYAIILSKDLKTGGYVLAGYLSKIDLPQEEIDLLKVCIETRMCQSLVIGAYTSMQYPENSKYVLTTATSGWKVLKELFEKSEREVQEMWKNEAKSCTY